MAKGTVVKRQKELGGLQRELKRNSQEILKVAGRLAKLRKLRDELEQEITRLNEEKFRIQLSLGIKENEIALLKEVRFESP